MTEREVTMPGKTNCRKSDDGQGARRRKQKEDLAELRKRIDAKRRRLEIEQASLEAKNGEEQKRIADNVDTALDKLAEQAETMGAALAEQADAEHARLKELLESGQESNAEVIRAIREAESRLRESANEAELKLYKAAHEAQVKVFERNSEI